MKLKEMSEGELQNAHVVTAREIGFIHNSSAREVRDSQGTLLSELLSQKLSSRVKFVIAQSTERKVTLGIFYPEQTAAVNAIALRDFLNGKLKSLALAKQSEFITYGLNGRPAKHSPIDGNIALIGGGEIGRDPTKDEPSSMTLENVFDLRPIPYEYMEIVRALVLKKLDVTL